MWLDHRTHIILIDHKTHKMTSVSFVSFVSSVSSVTSASSPEIAGGRSASSGMVKERSASSAIA